MSSIIRSFLLGSSYIFRHKQLRSSYNSHRSSRTAQVIDRARHQHTSGSAPSSAASSPRSSYKPSLHSHSPIRERGEPLVSPPLSKSQILQMRDGQYAPHSPGAAGGRRHVVSHEWSSIRDAMHVAKNEHLSDVDALVSLFVSVRRLVAMEMLHIRAAKPKERIETGRCAIDPSSHDRLSPSIPFSLPQLDHSRDRCWTS